MTVKLDMSIGAVQADKAIPLPGSVASPVSGVVGVLSRELVSCISGDCPRRVEAATCRRGSAWTARKSHADHGN